jgi:hypothetical protein
LDNGTIILRITGTAPAPDYYYSLDATPPSILLIATTDPDIYVIENLSPGIYTITVSNGTCTFHIYNVEVGQGVDYGTIAPPSALSPQTFCDDATVANLQTTSGVNISWYYSETAPTPLSEDDDLENEHIYYATQSIDGCESERTPVKVILKDYIFLDAPILPDTIELCAPATLADIPTDGNTNLVWYDENGTLLPPPLTDYTLSNDEIYYVAQGAGGSCVTAIRKEVTISIIADTPAPDMETEQHVCDGALVADLITPNNQIVWYFEEDDLVPLAADVKLIDLHTYWAEQKAGSCKSNRVAVEVFVDKYPAPIAPPIQAICGMTNPTLGDLVVSGTGIRWYDATTGDGPLPLTTPIHDKDEFWVVQSSETCEGDPATVTITGECYSPMGTIFPFVHTGDATYNDQFVTTAKLYDLPPAGTVDKLNYIRRQTPIQTVRVTYYECGVDFIEGAPLNPGVIGVTNNPGLPILWDAIGVTVLGDVDPETLTSIADCPTTHIGKYNFKNVVPGKYVMEISRSGFLSRYAVIDVDADSDIYLGHRELLGGDVNGDGIVTEKDLSLIRPKITLYGSPLYNPTYDFDGDKTINNSDISIIRFMFGAYITIYEETDEWINH